MCVEYQNIKLYLLFALPIYLDYKLLKMICDLEDRIVLLNIEYGCKIRIVYI